MELYDKQGRMKYNPEYHENHGQNWGDEDLIYLCSMHDVMKRKNLSMALGRTETTVSTKLYMLKKHKRRLYETYRKLGKLI